MNRRSIIMVAGSALAAGVVSAGVAGYQNAFASPANPAMTLIASAAQTSILYRPCDTCIIASIPTGAHIGGTEIDAGTLADKTGQVVGHYTLQAVGVTPSTQAGPGELSLHAVLIIGSDQIVADGIEEPPDNAGTAAVVGGTGRFTNARGTIAYTDQPDGTTLLHVSLTGTA